MKKTISLIALLLVFSVLLGACVGQPEDTTGSTEGSTAGQTEPSTNKTEPTTEETVGNTEPSTEETVENTEPSETVENTELSAELNTAEDFEKFIKDNEWYWRALGCIFEKPEELPAWFYFYLGVGESGQFTPEESAFLADAYKEKNPNGNYDAVSDIKLPVTKINEALSILGVTVEDIKIPQSWVYYDKTDSYYFWVSDAYGVTDWSVTKVEEGTEGIVAVYWETDGRYYGDPDLETPTKGAKMVLTMQQQPDGTYRVLSNVPQD